MERALRMLERSNDDSRVRDALGRRKHLVVDAVTGEPVPFFVYRLRCGHLVSVWLVPLPAAKTALYCGECAPAREQAIVEVIAEVADAWVPPADRAEASCDVCLSAAAAGVAVPVEHMH